MIDATEIFNFFKKIGEEVIPFIPIIAYILLCILSRRRQMQQIPDRRHPVLNERSTTNLTLVGFNFAIICLVITLYKDQINQVSYSLFLFSLGLCCLFGSYILLYLRLRRLFDTISDGLTTNGIWALLLGMKEMFSSFPALEKSSKLFSILILLLSLYIAIDVFWKWKDRMKDG